MSKSRKKQKNLMKDLAKQRIERLFKLAEASYSVHPHRSNRYVTLARRIGMRYRIRLPASLRRRVCRSCNSYLVPGSSSKVRLKKGTVCITCLSCGRKMCIPYK
ncbi:MULTISPECIES: ribonuclease P protein component 4 [Methanohalophilus]|uniref:Ribonuclease P protein component 4 n=1 Tax=Methanohalophilus euhalobius TaxID=51203 RepID=A0A314ZPR5_9EURY|nr:MULTISPECIES: ribonuclease P protein component 4 [Methanohalophilus]KXS44359.1 MAG: ribonuclease P protein subunit RPR2 [Methanohalophilus sp. T328-1]RSD35024.1 MAG: ribonuclease P protein subunit RPR2 [Methanohalophilus sp.]OBZ35455.1 MAG: ribonuclease P [Methanohalophilus sp. DAL1]PQV43092.1 ribonuclease P protein subunit Rpp21 [Methanohalophilus euhalobius]RNI09340.1 ribonuclease P [Methanohalophilus euhalobius]